MNLKTRNIKIVSALLILYFGWGSTYLAISIALELFPPFLLTGIRFILAGLTFFLWSLYKGAKIPNINEILDILLTGFFLLFLGTGSIVWVEQYLSTGLTSIIWSTLPIWLIIMDKRRWKYYFSNNKLIVGLLIGLMGVIILLVDKELIRIFEKGALSAFIIAICGVICFAFGSLYSERNHFKSNTILRVSFQMVFVGFLSLLISVFIGEKIVYNLEISILNSFLGLIYLTVVGSQLAYLSYIWLLKVLPPTAVGTYTYVNPAIAIILGYCFLEENITNQKIMALFFILIGICMVNFFKSKA